MAALGTTALTLADWAKRLAPDGSIDNIVEILNQSNEIMPDVPWIEGNLPTGHRTTVRSGLPTATWRLLNYGVQPSKSATVQVDDTVGMLEAYSEVDKDLLALNGNSAAFRASEDAAFVEAMREEFNQTLFYGNQSLDVEEFTGLAPRFNSLSADNATNIIAGGGTGADNTSIWLIVWGERSVHGIFPKGSQAGLQVRDLGEDTKVDSGGRMHQVMRSHFQWKCGVSVRDWRQIVRIPNIDISELTKTGSTGADLTDLMIRAVERVYNKNTGRAVFYGNRTISSFLRRQMVNKSNVYLSLDELDGKKVMNFDGIPFHRVDAITNAETLVS